MREEGVDTLASRGGARSRTWGWGVRVLAPAMKYDYPPTVP